MTEPLDQRASRWVFLHGFTQTHQSWWPAIAALGHRWSQDGQRLPALLLPDLPGHGLSRPPESPLNSTAATLLDALGDGPGVIVGYSMGARTALTAAAIDATHDAGRRRVRGLVLVGGTAGIADPQARAERMTLDEARAERIESVGVEAFVDEWVRLDLFGGYSPDDLAYRHRNTSAGLAASLRQHGTGAQAPLWDRLATIEVPTLVIAGERDDKFVELGRQMSELIPAATFEVIPNADHAAHLQHPTAFANLVATWSDENLTS